MKEKPSLSQFKSIEAYFEISKWQNAIPFQNGLSIILMIQK